MNQLRGPVLIVALAIAGYLGFQSFTESDEGKIKARIAGFQEAASFPQDMGNIMRIAKSESLPGFFVEDCEVTVVIKGVVKRTFYGRDSIRAAVAQVLRFRGHLELKLNDPIIEIDESGQSAIVELTATIAYGPPDNFTAQQFEFRMRKIEEEWFVERATTVDTLRR